MFPPFHPHVDFLGRPLRNEQLPADEFMNQPTPSEEIQEEFPERPGEHASWFQPKQNRSPDQSASSFDRFTGIGPILKITQSAYQEILADLVEQPFRNEKAGMLLGPAAEDDLVTHYIPDRKGRATPSSFTLDADGLNKTLRKYKQVNLTCKGVVHAHPPGVLQPSFGDLLYVAKLFSNPKNKKTSQVLLPIICNGRFYPYLIDANRPQEILVANLILI